MSDGSLKNDADNNKQSAHRHFVNIEYLFVELHRTFNEHAQTNRCEFKNWKLIKINNLALRTQIFFQCETCNYQCSIFAQGDTDVVMDINKAATLETMRSGVGYAQLCEILAAMNYNVV